MNDEVKQRKIEHVNIALGQDISVAQSANWNDVQFVHQALPEVDLDEIDTSVSFLGHKLRYPIFISSLTGGHDDVTSINRNLARAAEHYGLALGVGSQRAGIVNPDVISSYAITREHAPKTYLIANIGAPQLITQAHHAPFTIEQVEHAICGCSRLLNGRKPLTDNARAACHLVRRFQDIARGIDVGCAGVHLPINAHAPTAGNAA